MGKKFVVWTLISVMFIFCLCSCEGKDTDASKGKKFTFSAGYTGADNDTWKQDNYYKYISDKLNIDVDFRTLSADSWIEKVRIWISSGDMPDVVNTDFNFSEYIKYGQQGLVKELPDNFEKNYPNLAFVLEMNGAMDFLRSEGNGKIYGLLRTMDGYTKDIDFYRNAYNNGENLSQLMDENPLIDEYGFAYRKDWAEKLGIKTSPIMEYDDFIAMVKAFKEADLGKVGKENVVGIAANHGEAPNIFVTAYNSSYKYFHKENGKYVCGFLEKETTDGVLAYAKAYRDGLLAPDFYTIKSQDLNSIFCSQKSGIIFPRAEVSALRTLKSDFKKANPNLVPEDCIDLCWIKSPDGKVHGRTDANFYGILYFSPKLSDEKFAKILKVIDYVGSPEGGPQIELGVPGVDYSEENGKYIVTRPRTESGEFRDMGELYPSWKFFNFFLKSLYFTRDQTDKHAYGLMDNLMNNKRKEPLSLMEKDIARTCYTSDEYAKFNAAYNINSLLAQVVVSEGDIEAVWKSKTDAMRPTAEKIIEDMNNKLLK